VEGEGMKFRPPDQMLMPWHPRFDVSTTRVSAMLNTSQQTVLRLIERGALRAYKLSDKPGSPWRINYDSVIAYIESIHKSYDLEQRF
jgi:excisionase family DNA binding protein